jgi:ATP-dependent Lon protease
MKTHNSKEKNSDFIEFSKKKLLYFNNLINNTINTYNKLRDLELITSSELSICIKKIEIIYKNCDNIKNKLISENDINKDEIISNLQNINNDFFTLFKTNGTKNILDILIITFGNEYVDYIINNEIFKILNKHFIPLSFIVLTRNNTNITNNNFSKNRLIDDNTIIHNYNNCECFDLSRTHKNFNIRIDGIKTCFHNNKDNKSIIINGLLDNVLINCYDNEIVVNKLNELENIYSSDEQFNSVNFKNYIHSLKLKDLLIYSNSDICNKYIGIKNNVNLMKQKTISNLVKDFLNEDLFNQRKTIISLLIHNDDPEKHYLAYLFYDLLSNNDKGSIDSKEQKMIYDSLPWNLKSKFKEAMKLTIDYTKNISNFDNNKIPLEQQICLMRVNDNVKEKAMNKLKEVKAKSEDSGSKARQYLDGLLKIPFGIYKKEHCLTIQNELIKNILSFLKTYNLYDDVLSNNNISSNNLDICDAKKIISYINNNYIKNIDKNIIEQIKYHFTNNKRNQLIKNIISINEYIKKFNINHKKLLHSGKKSIFLKEQINNFVGCIHDECIISLINNFNIGIHKNINFKQDFNNINNSFFDIKNTMNTIRDTLDKSVYGHSKAKRQIERIIGQWMSGELKGYCFGFEGAPGIGKCFEKNTPIMLFDGKIKMVQDITLQDKLMGDDSYPRNVLALGNGYEKMYRIQQEHGEDYVVNESHILSLKVVNLEETNINILGNYYNNNDVIDISIIDYLKLPKYLKSFLKGYKVPLNFRKEDVLLEPYAIGYWLGNKNNISFKIKIYEDKIMEYFKNYTKCNNTNLNKTHKYTYHISSISKNIFNDALQHYNLIYYKHIPKEYKITCREDRLSLLAGLIDSFGYYKNNSFVITISKDNLLLGNDIMFVAQSLGMKTNLKENKTKYKIFISGYGIDEIPVLTYYKKPTTQNKIKNYLNSKIKVIPLEEDKYYGFQIDGNSRFLLGDFTVTHNTSLAKKGLAKCLTDKDGQTRPFGFIAIGGSSNGSTLEGHNYTYVGSTWGRIVDILMESKCMNPIIFIDELDKVSKTEHGKEIIGILTHLVDTTQNDTFQDKYFNGVDIDLSKALFIFSYNDVSLIDRILLDRIHRVKFDNLNVKDKIVITKQYILPEIYDKINLKNAVLFDDNIIEYIIENYTCESGVRKLKEIIFEIISEINLQILREEDNNNSYPIQITIDLLKNKYLKNHREVKYKLIHKNNEIGIINGLWANSIGQGGIIPIQTTFFPTSTFLELKLTGMQGDVMKESMNVAKSLAYKLTSAKRQKELIKIFKESNLQGLHIHCPEGAVPKDGPSAGTAITSCIYSLFNNRKIKNNVAITGEINLQGYVTAIGGLELKIIGGIKAGITEFIYPSENEDDFQEFMKNHKDDPIINNIIFHSVQNIQQVFKIVFS